MSNNEWEHLLTMELIKKTQLIKDLQEENEYLRECITRLESGTNSVLESLGGGRV